LWGNRFCVANFAYLKLFSAFKLVGKQARIGDTFRTKIETHYPYYRPQTAKLYRISKKICGRHDGNLSPPTRQYFPLATKSIRIVIYQTI